MVSNAVLSCRYVGCTNYYYYYYYIKQCQRFWVIRNFEIFEIIAIFFLQIKKNIVHISVLLIEKIKFSLFYFYVFRILWLMINRYIRYFVFLTSSSLVSYISWIYLTIGNRWTYKYTIYKYATKPKVVLCK